MNLTKNGERRASVETAPADRRHADTTAEYMEAIRMFGDVPTLSILYFLAEGPKRFLELQRLTSLNPVTLTARLKRLVEQQIVTRSTQEVDRQAVSYALDAAGEETVPILRAIEDFARALTHQPPR